MMVSNPYEKIKQKQRINMTRHEFFQIRLQELGVMDKDSDYNGLLGQAVSELSETVSKQGHSGTSAILTVQLFNKLMKEWHDPKPNIAFDP